jgi:AraC-like DNA-binding protein
MIVLPDHMTVRPVREDRAMTDALSDILRSVRLIGGVFVDARLTAPWAIHSVVTMEACRPLLSRPAQIIAYHFVLEGSALLSVDGQPPVRVGAGEIVLLPRNDAHLVASAPSIAPVDGYSLIEASPDGGLARIRYGGGGEPTRIICGFLGSEDALGPLIRGLPRILAIDIRDGTSREMIEASLKFAAGELVQGRLASSDTLARLSELLLIEAVRRYTAKFDGQLAGWLKGLNDPRIGRALATIHQDIAAPWSVDGLAREVAMSRSAFVARFTALVGMPPIRYITVWRMEAAKLGLRESFKSVAHVAHSVGYDSEEAFSRAFKRETGCAPALWREQHTHH